MARLFLPLIAMILASAFAMPASAQLPVTPQAPAETAVELPDPLTPEAVNALVARLSDDEVRALLLQRLDAVAS